MKTGCLFRMASAMRQRQDGSADALAHVESYGRRYGWSPQVIAVHAVLVGRIARQGRAAGRLGRAARAGLGMVA